MTIPAAGQPSHLSDKIGDASEYTFEVPHEHELLSDRLEGASHRIEPSRDADAYEIDDLSVPDAVPPFSRRLIACATSAAHRIAIDAESCPSCGAKNTWVHPEIKRFLD